MLQYQGKSQRFLHGVIRAAVLSTVPYQSLWDFLLRASRAREHSTMNRVLIHLGHNCQHCKAQRVLDEFKRVAESIEDAATEDVIGFWMPGLAEFVDNGDRETRFFIQIEPVKTTIDADLFEYTTSELRRIAGELTAAADRVDLRQSGNGVAK